MRKLALFPAFLQATANCIARSCLVSSGPSTIRYLLAQKRYMSVPKIRLKVDPCLDEGAIRDFKLSPIFKIRDYILRHAGGIVRLIHLNARSNSLGLRNKAVKAKGFIKRYPNIFEIFSRYGDPLPWVRLTTCALDLVEEEKRIFNEIEDQVVLKLRKMLMMSQTRQIRVGKLQYSRRCFGLPSDFATRVAFAYPQYFRFVHEGDKPVLELVEWDDSLAISYFERKRKEEACNAGLGEIETRGQPLEFPTSYSPGMFLRKKNLELLEKWQKVPYTSPYQDGRGLKHGTILYDKRVIAVLHEILSLTVEKKALMRTLGRFNKEFGMPRSIGRAIRRFPGIFYLSCKGARETVFLRDGYDGTELLEDHPLIHLKNKYVQMVVEGPRICSCMKSIRNLDLEDGSEEENEDEPDAADSECDDSDYDSGHGEDGHQKSDDSEFDYSDYDNGSCEEEHQKKDIW